MLHTYHIRTSCAISFANDGAANSGILQIKSSSTTGAESPTTAQPLDMDDDDIQESGVLSNEAGSLRHAAVEDEAPPKPPRPLNPQQQAENTLKEAFPTIDAAVIKAVLMASGGRVEPAFNALLGNAQQYLLRLHLT